MKKMTVVDIFSVSNFIIAGIFAIAVIFTAINIEYGILSTDDPGLDVREGSPIRTLLLILFLIGTFIYLAGGIGLKKRRLWGYYIHIVGAILTFFTIVLCAYSIISLIFATESEFKDQFKTKKFE
jgi:hypothetical protein